MYAVLKTPPATEPITLAEAQAQLKVDGEDDYINALISTARVMIERYLNRSLISQTWTAYSDDWCDLELPYPPLISVTSVKYYGLDSETLTTLNETQYYWVNTVKEPGCIDFKYGTVKPLLIYEKPNRIEVEYVAGYADASSIPAPIKHAIKILITDMYENRGQYVIGANVNKIPNYITDLIHTYKIYGF